MFNDFVAFAQLRNTKWDSFAIFVDYFFVSSRLRLSKKSQYRIRLEKKIKIVFSLCPTER